MKTVFSKQFILCFVLAWMITNGWAYLFMGIGMYFKSNLLISISAFYLTIIWLPFTPEKVLTVAIALWMKRKIFQNI